ncbi:MAG: transposase [Bdellovibrionota bacterium]
MPRNPVIRSNEHFYHLTGRSNNKEDFFLPTPEVWEIMMRELNKLQRESELKISAFVLMNNHFHLLALTPNEPIDRVMYFFMKNVTKKMQKRTGRINKIFGGRYKGCLIDNSKYLLNVYKYIYRNPVAAGMVERAEEYPFSTFHIKNEAFTIQLDKVMPMNIAISDHVEKQWVNSTFEDEEVESLKWGLSKTKFKYKKERYRRKEIGPYLTF